jgi:hypothetical protein
MLLPRLFAVLLVIVVGLSLLAFVLTGEKKHLVRAGQLIRYGAIFAVVVFAVVVLNHLLVF